jgi:hypothetical protein
MRNSNGNEVFPPPKPSRAEAIGDYAVIMRLTATGAIISNRGGGEDFAEAVAYSERLLQLVGELFGLEPF